MVAKRRPTVWVPLSAYYFDDPALIAVGDAAELLFVRMLAYAARTPEREGAMTYREVETRLGLGSGTLSGTDSGTPSVRDMVRALADHGLLTLEGDVVRITSWLRWNQSRDEKERIRASDRKRKTTRRSRPDEVSGTPSGTGSGTPSGRIPGRVPGRLPGPKKVDGRDTSKDVSDDRVTGVTRTTSSRRFVYPADFEAFWAAYPKRADKKAAFRAWKRAVKEIPNDELVEAAAAYARDPGRNPEYTKNAATWLNAGSWANEPARPAPRQVASMWDYPEPGGAP